MNGAESLVGTLVASGIEVCFANPGTSEMHFVAALDKINGMRAILCLFEGVVTGAADGYGQLCSARFGVDSILAQRSDCGGGRGSRGSGVNGAARPDCDPHFAGRYSLVGSRSPGAAARSASDCCGGCQSCRPSG